jgi:hypothetical protein
LPGAAETAVIPVANATRVPTINARFGFISFPFGCWIRLSEFA